MGLKNNLYTPVISTVRIITYSIDFSYKKTIYPYYEGEF